MARTRNVSESVEQLLRYRDENADVYWDRRDKATLWISSSPDSMSDSRYIRIGGYENFLEASGHETLEDLPGEQVITVGIEIPDRGPGRPRQRQEPVERSTIDLPTSLWQALDEARGDKSRRAFIDASVRERIEKVPGAGASAEAVMASFDAALKTAMDYEGHGGAWDREDAQQEFALLADWLNARLQHHG